MTNMTGTWAGRAAGRGEVCWGVSYWQGGEADRQGRSPSLPANHLHPAPPNLFSLGASCSASSGCRHTSTLCRQDTSGPSRAPEQMALALAEGERSRGWGREGGLKRSAILLREGRPRPGRHRRLSAPAAAGLEMNPEGCRAGGGQTGEHRPGSHGQGLEGTAEG